MPDVEAPATGRSTRRVATQVVVAVLVAVLALAVTLQLRSVPEEDFDNVRSEDLVELLKSLDSANQRLDAQIGDLTATRDDLLDSSKRSETAEKEARARADALAILAGAVGAAGPGVTVSVQDPSRGVDAAAMLDAIEELRNAGAEAIVVNGSARVVGSTYLVDDEEGIRVDGRVIQPPYVIEAIGSPETLAEATRIIGGLVDTLENRGATVTVVEQDRITITALADAEAPEYARPDS